jgi:alanine racemase
LPPVPASLAASFALFLGPEYHFDIVRPGAALYGVNPTPNDPNPMAQVIRLKGKILQVREIDEGMTVGYGAAHRMRRPGRVATVAVGYADGWLRSSSQRGSAKIGGQRVAIIGRISMDLLTLDVTEADPALAQPGGFVDLIDESHGVDAVAAAAGTIGYEILTALGRRPHRVYRGGAG